TSAVHSQRPPQDQPASPTRRSSDLRHTTFARSPRSVASAIAPAARQTKSPACALTTSNGLLIGSLPALTRPWFAHRRVRAGRDRSEEHTSELQSPYDVVCRLLLDKT